MAQWDVQGKVCVVTGGGSGIGEGLAIRLAQGGAAAVMVADIDMTSCQAVAAKLVNPKTGENVGSACKVDCSSEASIRRLIVTAEFKIGPIDVFISNAGIPSNGGVRNSHAYSRTHPSSFSFFFWGGVTSNANTQPGVCTNIRV